ncbi:MAG: PmoA family protein [Pirellulaceae bacterium]
MKRIALLSAALFLFAGQGYGDEAQSVSARKEDDRIVVDVDGETFTEYLFGKEHKYPFFYPVVGPASGRSVTAWDQEPYPHHSSLYISLDNVRSENVSRGNYWQPRDRLDTGHVLSRNARILEDDQKRVVLRDEADWIVPAAESHQLKDTRTVTIWAPSPTVRVMDFEFDFEALKDLEIRQTGHSFFSARMRPEIAVGDQDGKGRGPGEVQDMGTGTIVDSRGSRNESGTQKTTADWCAYYGENNGATEGLAVIQHSGNPFYPASWFVRDYGFMSPSPFSFDGDRKLEAGETLTFRYRVVVFTGDHETADIAGWRDKFEDAF